MGKKFKLREGNEMYKEIKSSTTWKLIKPINKGWSTDLKYYIETNNHEKLLLRIADISCYDEKKKEYEIIGKYSKLGFIMSMPIEFGVCNENRQVYMLLTWIEGDDLEEVLPKLSHEKQYKLGREAGMILKKIHNLEVLDSEIPKETKIPKKLNQIHLYMNSNVRIENDDLALAYTKNNIDKIWRMNPCYLHGDFHPGNLILTSNGKIGVIDFNRWEIGDPYEEFYKLESFGVELSIPYCIGQIDSYFENQIPLQFWEALAVYVAHASLYSIKWAEKFGQNETDEMIKRCKRAFNHYDNFHLIIPTWYEQYKKGS